MSDDRFDGEDARRYRRRLKRQRKYQSDYREQLKGAGIPETRDLAAAAFAILVEDLAARPREPALAFAKKIAERLPTRFDRGEAVRAIGRLMARARQRQGA
ncbi:MAG: hypothetical protein ACFE0R_13930 [Salinarimonas sp.]